MGFFFDESRQFTPTSAVEERWRSLRLREAARQLCEAWVILCPDALTNRRIVVSDEAMIRIAVKSLEQDVVATVYRQKGRPLEGGDVVELRKSNHSTLLIKSPSKDYFQLLRTKLHWGER